MKSHKQEINTKLSFWESEKQKGSKGEILTRDFLRKHKLDFKEQVAFQDLYYKNKNFPLKFDFQIWFNEKWFLLEIDGLQHFSPCSFGSHLTEQEIQKNFEESQERDLLKNEYCESHGFILKRIIWDGNKNKLLRNLQKMFAEI
jgi:hypothetical protein